MEHGRHPVQTLNSPFLPPNNVCSVILNVTNGQSAEYGSIFEDIPPRPFYEAPGSWFGTDFDFEYIIDDENFNGPQLRSDT